MELTEKQKKRRESGNKKAKLTKMDDSIELKCSWFNHETLFYFIMFLMLWIVYFLISNNLILTLFVLSIILIFFTYKLFNKTVIYTTKDSFRISYLLLPFWKKTVPTKKIAQFYCKKEERYFSLILFDGKLETTVFHSKDPETIYYIEDVLESFLNITDDFFTNEYSEEKFQ
ncbi:hypothetical protein JXR93_09540 [bacterium]|nr:hypothetical protein [bacterium]